MSETNQAKWYVVQTFAGYEKNFASNLATKVQNSGMQDLIQVIKIPMESVTVIKNGVEREVERIIIPSYVYIKMIVTNDSWYLVRNTHGCSGFVGPGGQPTPLTDAEVSALNLEENNVEEHGVEVGYSEGDNVKIISGPLEGYSGVVKSIDLTSNNVCVVLSMFGRETPVELELDQISLED